MSKEAAATITTPKKSATYQSKSYENLRYRRKKQQVESHSH